MSTLTAGQVMDRSAALMNDPAKTDYTYAAQLPYLNIALDELVESLQESNSSPTNQTTASITIPVGTNQILPAEYLTGVLYPVDLVEVQEVLERTAGTNDSFIRLTRREFVDVAPPSNSLMFWAWQDTIIQFNPRGALTTREVQLRYISQAITNVTDPDQKIGYINLKSYLAYKTAGLCAMYIGENQTRAAALDSQAEKALERLIGLDNKGRQQIMTRHRPFRAAYKSRGGF